MKKALLFATVVCCLLFAGITNYAQGTSKQKPQKTQDSVYICNSQQAYAYHLSKNCRGLNRCNHGIFKTSVQDAINIYHRQPCKICTR